jgi:hypothetical protein
VSSWRERWRDSLPEIRDAELDECIFAMRCLMANPDEARALWRQIVLETPDD